MRYYLDENDSKIKNINKINFIYIYVFLFIITGLFIYFYSGYEYNYFNFVFPYTMIWQLSLVLAGISMIKVKNIAYLSIGLVVTILALAITTISIFNYQFNVKNNKQSNFIKVENIQKLNIDIDITASSTNIKSDNNILKFDFSSNYDNGFFNTNKDENQVQDIKLEQKLLPPGLGLYNKFNELELPKSIPVSLNIKSNLSNLKANLSNIKLSSADILATNSQADILIKDLDIKGEAFLNLKSILSNIQIEISKDIQVIITNSSKLSQNSFEGIEKDTSNSKTYKSAWVPMQYSDNNSNDSNIYKTEQKKVYNELSNEVNKEVVNYQKILIINLDSTLSRVKIIQR